MQLNKEERNDIYNALHSYTVLLREEVKTLKDIVSILERENDIKRLKEKEIELLKYETLILKFIK